MVGNKAKKTNGGLISTYGMAHHKRKTIARFPINYCYFLIPIVEVVKTILMDVTQDFHIYKWKRQELNPDV